MRGTKFNLNNKKESKLLELEASSKGKEYFGNAFKFILSLYDGRRIALLSEMERYLNNDLESVNVDNEISNNDETQQTVASMEKRGFNDLPPSTILKIFSYLDVANICRVSRCCQHWNNISNDEVFWRQKLEADSKVWNVVDHLTHPSLHKQMDPDGQLTSKMIYIRCSPKEYRSSQMHFLPNLSEISYLFGRTLPRIAMFGSGLDEPGFMEKILWDKASPFSVKGMLPRQFEGFGSEVTQFGGEKMNLIMLRGQTKEVREQRNQGEQQVSKYLEESDEGSLVLRQPVRELCTTVDAFIYIVKAKNMREVASTQHEFTAMIDTRWMKQRAPLLMLCLVPNATVECVPVIEVADQHKLLAINRPWQVRQCHANSLYGLTFGLEWLIIRLTRLFEGHLRSNTVTRMLRE